MSQYDRLSGQIIREVAVIRAIVERHTRAIDEDRGKAMASLSFLSGVAYTLTAISGPEPKNKPARPSRDEPVK